MLDSQLTSTVVVNIANQYLDPLAPPGQYRVDKIDYDLDDPLTMALMWGGNSTPFLYLAGRGVMDVGMSLGGLQNDESLNVRDGRILAKTYGFTSGSLTFSVVLHLVKQTLGAATVGNNDILMENSGDVLLEDGFFILLE